MGGFATEGDAVKREIEDELERRIRSGVWSSDAIFAMIDEGLIASHKQAVRTLEKWERKGRWQGGVSQFGGWFIDPPPKGPTP